MSQNSQSHFKNLAANAARFLKWVWPFSDIMQYRAKKFINQDCQQKMVNSNFVNAVKFDQRT